MRKAMRILLKPCPKHTVHCNDNKIITNCDYMWSIYYFVLFHLEARFL